MANKNLHNEQFEELCAGYVLNALDENEREQFEQMLEDATEEQQRLYQKLSSAANQLAFAADENEPLESLRDRLMAQIRADAGEKPASSAASATTIEKEQDQEDKNTFSWATFSAAAAFALLIVSLSLLFYSFNLSFQIKNQESTITDQQTEITELEDEIQQKEEMLAILGSHEVDMVVLSGLEINPEGFGKVIWDADNRQALLQVANLPPVPTDKDYQLWIIRDNEPVSAGVFAVSDSTDNFFKIEGMAAADEQSANAFAITREPKGGMDQPTGSMYLLGDLNGDSEE